MSEGNFQAGPESAVAPETSARELVLFIPNLLKLLYRLVNDRRVSTGDRALLLGTVAYVLSPWDFLPDMIPFMGQLDDLLLIALVLKRIMDRVDHEVLLAYWDGDRNLLEVVEKILNLVVNLIPRGIYRKLLLKSRSPA